jgi:hypothetical protein
VIPDRYRPPTRDLLRCRLTDTLELLEHHVGRLEDYAPFWTDAGGSGQLEDKVASECALLVMLTQRCAPPSSPLAQLAARVGESVATTIRSNHNRRSIMRTPQAAATIGQGHIYLRCAGHRDPEWDSLVLGALKRGYGEVQERHPHRLLDRRWTRQLIGLPSSSDGVDLLSVSIIESRAHPLYMSQDDAYAYTHALMYLTDFGARPPEPAMTRSRITQVVNACLAWTLLDGDYDLLTEFMLGYVLLRQRWTHHAEFAWTVLNETWDRMGFLPGPTFDEEVFSPLLGDERRAYAFREMYHTNVVGGLLCAVLLAQDGESLSDPPIPPSVPESLVQSIEQAILRAVSFCDIRQEELESDGHDTVPLSTGQWKVTPDKLIERCRRLSGREGGAVPVWADVAVAGLVAPPLVSRILLEGLTVQAVRQYNLAEIARCLEEMTGLGLGNTSTYQETVEFLVNQQVDCGAIGTPFVDQQYLVSRAARDVTRPLIGCLALVHGCLSASQRPRDVVRI